MAAKKLTRSANKMVGGVCAGLAEYFGIDATAMRLAYVVASIFLPGIILYIVLLLIMPEAAPKANNVEDVEFTEAEPKKGAKKK